MRYTKRTFNWLFIILLPSSFPLYTVFIFLPPSCLSPLHFFLYPISICLRPSFLSPLHSFLSLPYTLYFPLYTIFFPLHSFSFLSTPAFSPLYTISSPLYYLSLHSLSFPSTLPLSTIAFLLIYSILLLPHKFKYGKEGKEDSKIVKDEQVTRIRSRLG